MKPLPKRLVNTAFIFFLLLVAAGLCFLGLAACFVVAKDIPIVCAIAALVLLWMAWDWSKPSK